MKKQKIVLFDIDYTLFDVGYFDKYFHKKLSKLLKLKENVVRELSIKIIMDLVTEEAFLDIDKYLDKITSELNKKDYKKRIENLLFNSSFFKKGFYKEVEETLRNVERIAKIGIFSQGDMKFQWAKIEQSGFKHLFDKDLVYIIKPRKLDFLQSLKKKHSKDRIYLVDDKPKVIHEVKENFSSVFTIWLKRGKYTEQAKEIDGFKPDATIDNLSEVVEIVKSN